MRLSPSLPLCALVALGGAAPWARPQGFTLTDQAVTLDYPAAHWSASPMAHLLGTAPSDVLYNSGWWYRLPGGTRERPLPAPTNVSHSGGDSVCDWLNLDGSGFRLQLRESVFDHEGPSGGFWAQLLVINESNAAGTMTVFHYLDADAAGSATGDAGQLLTPVFFEQSEGAHVLRYRGVSNYANFNTSVIGVAALFPTLRDRLNDTIADDFFPATGSVGPGDVTAAYQFKATLQPGQGMWAEVAFGSNLPSRYVKGSGPDRAPFASLVYHDTQYNRTQVMRRSAMIHGAQDFPPAGWGSVVGVDDFDGDYTNDVLYRDGAGNVRIDGQSLTGAAPPPLNWVVTATGDFDADGRADIVWRNTTSQKLTVWFMNGAARVGTQAPNPDHAVDGNWDATGTADFNGDGFRDLLWYNRTSGKLVIWYLDGALVRIAGGFTDPPSVGSNAWRVVALGDYGKGPAGVLPAAWNAPDVVWQNSTSYKIVIWFMDAQGRRTSGAFTSPDTFGPWQTVVGPR